MRVLITRPEEDAAALAAALRARGHEPCLEPLLRIEPAAGVAAPLELDGVQAVIFTSANGVRAFARLSPRRDLPVFAVGDASARAALEAGFKETASAAGDVEDLARLVAARLKPGGGALFHGAGQSLAGDLKAHLESAGFTLRREVLYRATAVSALSAPTRTALSDGNIDAAAFFSPRTAGTFVDLIQAGGLTAACGSIEAHCLSAAVAERLRVLPWRNVRIAARPNQEALLESIDAMTAAVEETMSEPDETAEPKGEGAAAREVIAKFGGIRPMASKLGVAVSTVQGWRERGSIPSSHHDQIKIAAETHDIGIDAAVLSASDIAPEAHGEEDGAAKDGVAAAPASRLPESGQPRGPAQTNGAAPSRPPRGGAWVGAFLIAAVLFTIGAGAAVLTREAWTPLLAGQLGADPNAARIADLERDLSDLAAKLSQTPDDSPTSARIDALEGRLDDLASRPDGAALQETGAEIAALRTGLASLTSRLEAMADIAATGGDSEALAAALAQTEARLKETADDVAGLRAQLAALSETRAGSPAEGTAMILAVLQIRDALRGAEPFETALTALDAALDGAGGAGAEALRAAIAPLRPHAAGGAPSLDSLQAAFPAVARAAIAQSRGGEDDGMLAKALRRLSGLVSIRPLGPVEGDSAEAIVARAEAQLESGDLSSALGELDSLNGPATEAAAEWRGQAEARLTVQAALAHLGGLLAAGPLTVRD